MSTQPITTIKSNYAVKLEVQLLSLLTIQKIEESLVKNESFFVDFVLNATEEEIVEIIFESIPAKVDAKNFIEKLTEISWRFKNRIDSDDFYTENLISRKSYCDTDLGYNTVVEVEMSDEYQLIEALADKFYELDSFIPDNK